MNQPADANHLVYRRLSWDVEKFNSLANLAFDLRWSWNHSADEVWRQKWIRASGASLTPGSDNFAPPPAGR